MKLLTLFFLAAVSILVYAYSTGIVGVTRLNGEGCVCHNLEPDSSVHTWIVGPAWLTAGDSAVYKLYAAGGPAVKGGFNAAVRFGNLSPAGAGTQKFGSELTHSYPGTFASDTVMWQFNYTAAGAGTDTIYAAVLSADGNTTPGTEDKWNFASGFSIVINPAIPVELSSFTYSVSDHEIMLYWSTASETNNRGFSVERRNLDEQLWDSIGFVSGAGTELKSNNYSFRDPVLPAGYEYRLKQIDFDGTSAYSEIIQVQGNVDAGRFMMLQNYPNPFNPSTIIKYEVPLNKTHLHVNLSIYDLRGKRVSVLVNEEKQSGTYSAVFNPHAEGLSSGVYLCRLTAGSSSVVQKIVFMK